MQSGDIKLSDTAGNGTPFKGKLGVPVWFAGKVSPAFKDHLFWPSPPKKEAKKAVKEILPACCSTSKWRELYRDKKTNGAKKEVSEKSVLKKKAATKKPAKKVNSCTVSPQMPALAGPEPVVMSTTSTTALELDKTECTDNDDKASKKIKKSRQAVRDNNNNNNSSNNNSKDSSRKPTTTEDRNDESCLGKHSANLKRKPTKESTKPTKRKPKLLRLQKMKMRPPACIAILKLNREKTSFAARSVSAGHTRSVPEFLRRMFILYAICTASRLDDLSVNVACS